MKHDDIVGKYGKNWIKIRKNTLEFLKIRYFQQIQTYFTVFKPALNVFPTDHDVDNFLLSFDYWI